MVTGTATQGENAIDTIVADDDNDVVKAWKQKHMSNDNGIMKQNPKFTLQTTTHKWEEVQTEVIGVTCAKSDAQYLKYVLSRAAENTIGQYVIYTHRNTYDCRTRNFYKSSAIT